MSSSICRVRGDDWTIVGTCGGSGDLTGTVSSQMRRSTEGPVVAAFTATITDAAAREVTLSLSDEITAEIAPGSYLYDVQVVSGSVTTTYGPGSRLVVVADVTR